MGLDARSGDRNNAGVERFGRNVTVHALYFRHAEKASGLVGSGSQISASLISPRGKVQSESLGAHLGNLLVPGADGVKIRSSLQPRTRETANAVVGAYQVPTKIDKFHPRVKWELSADTQPKSYSKAYIEKWEANKNKLMTERGIDPKDFSKLTPKEQAEIAEPAEEPVAEEWLDNPESEMAQLFPLEVAAAQIAVLVRRDMQTAGRLNSGSSVDLFNSTHRTMTEPLLMRIIQLPEGKKPEKLADIGGLLGLNDGFELRTETDQKGTPTVKLFMYRVKNRESDKPEYDQTEYGIDVTELNRLADLGLELKRHNESKKES